MKYTFLAIQGDTVLLLDTTRNVVVRFPIEDYAGGYEDAPPPPRRPVVRRAPVREAYSPEDVDRLPEPREEELPPERPVSGKPKSIVPPHLRGIFLPPDAPGADVERRDI